MILSVHQPHYIPWLGYVDKIARSDCFIFLDEVQYKPREFQNRNLIRAPKGGQWLTVPVLNKGRSRQKIKDVAVDNTQHWQQRHAHALKSCYAAAPFFAEHEGFLREVYACQWERLSALNIFMIKYVLTYLGIKTPLYLESEIKTAARGTERIIELCGAMRCDAYLSGAGGRAYLDEDAFRRAGITLVYQEFSHPVYRQLFASSGSGFIPNMSVLDLLFNEGARSREILGLRSDEMMK